ncbi:MAG: prephenate dehydrogenase [Parasphingorhabdus sp.]|jgi:prephenate dehydrogenase
MKTIDTLLVVGVGLIGGSLSLALKKHGLVNHVIGYGRNQSNLDQGVELGVIDEACADLGDAAARANIILLACPVGAIGNVLDTLVDRISDQTIITDAGSSKGSVVDVARNSLGEKFSRFVPGHPIAGSEKSGVTAAFAELYEKHRVLLTPVAETAIDAVERVSDIWRSSGATVTCMDPAEHDRVLGLTSHLPHVLAYALVDYLSSLPDAESCFELAAGGFYDFTRIASSDPIMWRDITLENREKVLMAIDGYQARLGILRELVANGNAGEVEKLFRSARDSRNKLLDRRKTQVS